MSAAIREVAFVPGKHCNICGCTRYEARSSACGSPYPGVNPDQHDWRLPSEDEDA